jgi:hypothetical protein
MKNRIQPKAGRTHPLKPLSKRLLATVGAVASLFLVVACSTGLSRYLLEDEINFFRSSKVPKILHFMILGEDPPEYMLEMVRFNEIYVAVIDPEFTTKLWRDEDVEKLVKDQNDPALSQAWEYVKADKRGSRYAKMADFIRPLILYVEGGVYLDADMVPCGGLEFMVNEPGVVNFPFTLPNSNQVNGAASSAPKGHRLMKMAMEYFISKGKAITTDHNLDAAGPAAMAVVTDKYIADLGFDKEFPDTTFPKFYDLEGNMYSDLPNATGVVETDHSGYAKFADIKYSRGAYNEHLYHLQFGSWKGQSNGKGHHDDRVCSKDPKEVIPFLMWFCMPENQSGRILFHDCGVANKK